MARFRKKPVVIEAFQLGIDYIPDWFMDKVTENQAILHGTSSGFDHHEDTNADIVTPEGVMHANFGDFIIKGVKGEIYPCKPEIFKATYEPASVAAESKEKQIEEVARDIIKAARESEKPIDICKERIKNAIVELLGNAKSEEESVGLALMLLATLEEAVKEGLETAEKELNERVAHEQD